MNVENGRSLNTRNPAVVNAWINFYICITTNDVNEFYKALSGNNPRKKGHHYTWEEVNKTREPYKTTHKIKPKRK